MPNGKILIHLRIAWADIMPNMLEALSIPLPTQCVGDSKFQHSAICYCLINGYTFSEIRKFSHFPEMPTHCMDNDRNFRQYLRPRTARSV